MLSQHITPLYTIMSSYRLAKLHLKEEKKFTTLGLDAKLSKKNLNDCAESWSYLNYKKKQNGFESKAGLRIGFWLK